MKRWLHKVKITLIFAHLLFWIWSSYWIFRKITLNLQTLQPALQVSLKENKFQTPNKQMCHFNCPQRPYPIKRVANHNTLIFCFAKTLPGCIFCLALNIQPAYPLVSTNATKDCHWRAELSGGTGASVAAALVPGIAGACHSRGRGGGGGVSGAAGWSKMAMWCRTCPCHASRALCAAVACFVTASSEREREKTGSILSQRRRRRVLRVVARPKGGASATALF
jgi:hypothetical protein